MLLNNVIRDYEDFRNQFGTKQSRKKKIYLATMMHFARAKKISEFNFINETHIINSAKEFLRTNYKDHLLELNGTVFYSDIYKLDGLNGLCEDGDTNSIRYVRAEDNRVFKMKISKFFSKLLEENGINSRFGSVFSNYFVEVLTQDYKAFVKENVFSLKIDEDFEFIYDNENYVSGSFGSCMVNKGFEGFYYHDVEQVQAVSLVDANDVIYARCLLFNDVSDEDGNTYRLADRQYASEEIHKQVLINKLIEAELIDGYKTFNAGAGDASAFVDVNENSLSHKTLSVFMQINDFDSVPYMDSFKYYNESEGIAYNKSYVAYDFELEVTDGRLERNWDEYNQEHTNDDLTTIYVWNSYYGYYNEVTCSDYYAENNLTWVEDLDGYADDAYYSDLLQEYIPHNRVDELEEEYMAENWNWDEYNSEYTEDEVVTVNVWNSYYGRYQEQSCSEDYAENNLTWVEDLGGYADDATYSDLLGKHLPNDRVEELEEEYMAENEDADMVEA